MLLRFDSLLRLVSSLLISVKPVGAPQVWVVEPWLTPKPARTISLVAVVAALVLIARLPTGARAAASVMVSALGSGWAWVSASVPVSGWALGQAWVLATA